jgi:alpha-glucosidase
MNFFRYAIFSLVFTFIWHDASAGAIVASPDGRIVFSAAVKERDELRYNITFGDEQAVRDSRLGLRFRNQAGFDAGFEILGVVNDSHDETWELPWGERRVVHDHYNQLLVRMGDGAGRRFDLRVRVFNDGVGFRYEVPAQSGFDSVQIVDELTEFHLPEGCTAWWIPGRDYNRYEYLYKKTGLDAIETAHTPMTVRTRMFSRPVYGPGQTGFG